MRKKAVYPHWMLAIITFMLYLFIAAAQGFAQKSDARAEMLRDPDNYEMRRADVTNQEQWKARKQDIREHLMLRAGLWPEPERTPLNAHIFDEVEGDGFTVAKVYFESLPGFLATGNLYRPTTGKPPYPAIVTPHGHWGHGRLENSEQGSIPGRCIDFARMGFVVFTIDMIGYNDSFQIPHNEYMRLAQMKADEPLPYEHRIFKSPFEFPEGELYGFTLGGLQLWNGMRTIDFLCSLPDVDKNRIGVTGASGGASQTIFLMIADERVKCASPVNIIGAEKHPGCGCENMPALWFDTSTVEMSAAFSPRPLLLMSATEDPWTPQTPTRELPMIREYYKLDNAASNVDNVHVNGVHNYNADTRAAVYEWFHIHLKPHGKLITKPVPVSKELKSLGDLRVFPDKMLPESALNGWKILDNWKKQSEAALQSLFPSSASGYNSFASTFRSKLANVLAVDVPSQDEVLAKKGKTNTKGAEFIGRKGRNDCFQIDTLSPDTAAKKSVLLVYPESWYRIVEDCPITAEYIDRGYKVFRIHGYASGALSIPAKTYDSYSWSGTYNRSNLMDGIQDIVTAIAYIKKANPGLSLEVAGYGTCGLETMFACAASGKTDSVIIDMNDSDPGYDSELDGLMPIPELKRIGDFRTAALLLMEKPLVLKNPGATFDTAWYLKTAKTINSDSNFVIEN